VNKYPQPIIVYERPCHCISCKKDHINDFIRNIAAKVPLVNGGVCIIDIQKCIYCKSYFIDKNSLKENEKEYGRLLIERQSMACYEADSDSDLYDSMKDKSFLSLCGYKVGKSGLPAWKRRLKLKFLLDSGKRTKYEIKELLSMLIATRKGENFDCARSHWQEDLRFVNDYDIENQKHEENFYFKEK
jgi:hypothetical protein